MIKKGKIKSFQELADSMSKKDIKRKEENKKPPFIRGKPYHPNKHSQPERKEGSKKEEVFLPLPNSVTKNIRWRECENFSLLFHRFIPYGSMWEIGKKKKVFWEITEEEGNNLVKKKEVIDFIERQANLAKSLCEFYGKDYFYEFYGETVYRLSIGLGNRSPLETGMTLHPLYGLPYLPGSAIKGVCRAWKLNDIASWLGILHISPEENKKEPSTISLLESILTYPLKEENSKEIMTKKWNSLKEVVKKINPGGKIIKDKICWEILRKDNEVKSHLFYFAFGSQNERGKVRFYDSYPVLEGNTKKLFELDIINVHYQPYYREKGEPPADYYNPIPNFFLTVPKGIRFHIYITSENKDLTNVVSEWLKKSLKEFGIGAKTSVGYGEIKEK